MGHVERADLRDAPSVMEIITLCIQHMRARGIHQWDKIYPNLQVVEDDIIRNRERRTPKFPRVPWPWWCLMAVLILSPGCANLFPTSTSGTSAPQLGQTLTPPQAATLAARLANDECERRHKKRPFAPEQYAAVLEGDVYRWGHLDEGGPGGLSALVTFAPDGSNPKVEVYFSTDIR
jgi:hypothetical protein